MYTIRTEGSITDTKQQINAKMFKRDHTSVYVQIHKNYTFMYKNSSYRYTDFQKVTHRIIIIDFSYAFTQTED